MRKITGIILSAAMIMSLAGCGGEDKIDDYGNGEVITGSGMSDEEIDPELAKEIESNKSDIAIDAEAKTYKDDFTNGSTNISINISGEKMHSYLELSEIYPVLSAKKVNAANLDAERYAKNLFGDTAVQLDETPKSTENRVVWDPGYDQNAMGYSEEEMPEKFKEYAFAEESTENKISYSYEGTYEGHEYYLVVTYDEETERAEMKMFPKNPGEMCGDATLSYVTPYDPAYFSLPAGNTFSVGNFIMQNKHVGYIQEDGELFVVDSTNGYELDIARNMADSPNKCKDLTNENLEERAAVFLEDDLGLSDAGGMTTAAASDAYYSTELYEDSEDEFVHVKEKSEEEKENARVELVYSAHNNFPNIDYYISVRDGYRVLLEGIYVRDIEREFGSDSSHGYVDISSEGIVGFSYSWKYLTTDILTVSTDFLEFDNLMASLKKAITESDELSNMMLKSISFTDMGICYAAVKSVDDPEEYSIIPVWDFTGYGPNYQIYTLYLNAIDGSVVYERGNR